METITKKLISIQKGLKVPKSQFNKFGNYYYRSAEDILEAVKPVCHANGCVLTIDENINEVGSESLLKATATVTDGKERASSSGFAFIDLHKKGMDKPQATGAASSYAIKRALGNLFAIDDTKDPDATNDHKTSSKPVLNTKNENWNAALKALQDGKRTVDQLKESFSIPENIYKILKTHEKL